MSTAHKNLSSFSTLGLPDIGQKHFGIVVAEWNEVVTNALCEGAIQTLLNYGAKREHIQKIEVPGSFELSLGAQKLAERKDIDAVIALGCVIQGETRHFDFICQAVAQGITEVGLKFNKPVIFGVLTTQTMEQALERAGGIHGNKGDEAAFTAIKMLGI